jgi:hypothetical protein
MKRPTTKGLLALCASVMLTACATIGPPQPPSLDLPKPPTDLRATRKGDRVLLTWTAPSFTTDRQIIRSLGPTKICRRLEAELSPCGTPAGEAAPQPIPKGMKSPNPKVLGSYTDSLPEQIQSDAPSAFLSYAIEVLNAGGRGAGLSNQVRVSSARTLPPPVDFSARVSGQGVVLSWKSVLPSQAATQPAHYTYRVYRRSEGSAEQILAGEVPAGTEPSLTITDSNIEWEKTYEYHAETVTLVAQENKPMVHVEGDDTPEIRVFTHDVFPPAVPSGLQAVSSGPGQQPFIDLIWAPVTDVDLDGYNVYRHEEGATPVKLNAEPLKTPAYRDASGAAGKSYLYSVAAVDVRGNESTRSEEAGETVP